MELVPERKIIGLSPSPRDQVLFALLDDGAVLSIGPSDKAWKELPPIPQLTPIMVQADESLAGFVDRIVTHPQRALVLKAVLNAHFGSDPGWTEQIINTVVKTHAKLDGANSDLLNVRERD